MRRYPFRSNSNKFIINPLNAELNPICHLLALLGAHHILHVSRIRVNSAKHNFICLLTEYICELVLNQGLPVTSECCHCELCSYFLVPYNCTQPCATSPSSCNYISIITIYMEVLPHAPYSPDTSPPDFDLFPKLKEPMCGHRFSSLEEVFCSGYPSHPRAEQKWHPKWNSKSSETLGCGH